MSKEKSVQVSERARSIPSSPIRRLEPFAAEAKKKGVKVYPLHIGQPDIDTPPAFFEALRNYNQSVVAYGASPGDAKLIEGISAYYKAKGLPIEPNNILITTGSAEALSFAVTTICDP